MNAVFGVSIPDRVPLPEYGAVICWGGAEPSKLLRALYSLRNQTLPVGEVVLVGDGLCAEQLSSYQAILPNIQVVSTTKRLGPAQARNFGMRHLDRHIQLVLIQDADDVSHPMRALTQVQSLSSGQLDVIGSQAVIITPKTGRIFGLPPRPTESSDVVAGLLDGRMTMVHSSVMLRRELFEAVGGYPDIRDRGEDFAMLQQMAHDGARIANLSETFYGYDHTLIRGPISYYADVKLRVPKRSEAMLRYLGHTGSRVFHSRLSPAMRAEWRKILLETQVFQ